MLPLNHAQKGLRHCSTINILWSRIFYNWIIELYLLYKRCKKFESYLLSYLLSCWWMCCAVGWCCCCCFRSSPSDPAGLECGPPCRINYRQWICKKIKLLLLLFIGLPQICFFYICIQIDVIVVTVIIMTIIVFVVIADEYMTG